MTDIFQLCSLCKMTWGLRWYLKAITCINQLSMWLLHGTHQDAIFIAHKTRGYNGFLLCKYFYIETILPKPSILNGEKIHVYGTNNSKKLVPGSVSFQLKVTNPPRNTLSWPSNSSSERWPNCATLNGSEQCVGNSNVNGYDPAEKRLSMNSWGVCSMVATSVTYQGRFSKLNVSRSLDSR